MAVRVDLRYATSLSAMDLRPRRYSANGLLLLLDWDDTLFPTSYLEARGIDDPSEASERVRSVMARVERRAISLVNCAMVTNVAIVTTASAGWVRDCLARWMPELRDVLIENSVEVFSASQRYDSGDGYDRKYWAFRYFYDDEDDVVVAGDGPYEKWAARALANVGPNVSFFGFIDSPTPDQLVDQLSFLHRCLRPLAHRYEACDFQLGFGSDSDSD